MGRLRVAILLLLVVAPVGGCGRAQSLPPLKRHVPPAAIIDGNRISQFDVQRSVAYSQRFYAWAHHTLVAKTACSLHLDSTACRGLYRAVLARMIEEHFVAGYAEHHGLTLSGADLARIDDEMVRFEGDRTSTSSLFVVLHTDRPFVRAMLGLELVVQKVEAVVVPYARIHGPTWRIRRIILPFSDRQQQKSMLHAATLLLSANHPLPSGAQVSVHWIAPFRLTAEVRLALEHIRVGRSVGPFVGARTVVVIQLQARQVRRYGRPAREAITTAYFRTWLRRRLARLSIRCFDPTGAPLTCPG